MRFVTSCKRVKIQVVERPLPNLPATDDVARLHANWNLKLLMQSKTQPLENTSEWPNSWPKSCIYKLPKEMVS